MYKVLISALLLSTTAASAQQSCEQHRSNRVVGTVAGAGLGGVLGNVIAGSGDKTLGTIIGAVVGGGVGNQVTKNNGNCANAYGYYDKSGTWVASTVGANQQTGYYDRDSNWVEGAPAGYYDNQGRWVAAQNAGNGGTTIGYRDRNGRWIAPASADFDAGNRYVTGTVPGYWQNGRWIAGTTSGSYDRNGRWQPGQVGGQRDANGNWIAAPQPGHYDQRGRWIAGTTRGRYDDRGVWIADNNGNYGNNGQGNAYGNGQGNAYGSSGQRDVRERFDRIETRIARGVDQGNLTRADAQRAGAELESIRRYDQSLRSRNGQLSARNENLVRARLDRLNDRLRSVRENG